MAPPSATRQSQLVSSLNDTGECVWDLHWPPRPTRSECDDEGDGDSHVSDTDGHTNVDEPTQADADHDSVCSDATDLSTASQNSMELRIEAGEILWKHETSYKNNAQRLKYLSYGRNLDYDYCVAQQLRRFVKLRGLVDPYPSGLTLAYYYIRTLESADAVVTFRFLDLPPELRNMIYIDLLTLPDQACACHTFCFPQILRTCSEIHDEAKDILYTENTITLAYSNIFGCPPSPDFPTHHAMLHREHHVVHDVSPDGDSLLVQACNEPLTGAEDPKFVPPYGNWLRKVQNLTIRLTVHTHAPGPQPRSWTQSHSDEHQFVTAAMLILASFLMDDHNIMVLTITFDHFTHGLKAEEPLILPLRVLYPLRRLSNIPSVHVEGSIEEGSHEYLVLPLQSSVTNFNAVKAFVMLCAEADAQRVLHHAMGIQQTDDEFAYSEYDWSLSGIRFHLTRYLNQTPPNNEFYDKEFLAAMACFQDIIDETDVSGNGRKKHKMDARIKDRRRLRKAYANAPGRPTNPEPAMDLEDLMGMVHP